MQRTHEKPSSKRLVLRAILIFIASYLLFLILWIQVKDQYGYAMTFMASNLVTLVKKVTFEEMKVEEPFILATFSPIREMRNLLIDIPVKTSSYTFNAPLTFGIMAALLSFTRKRTRACVEALLILLGVHLLYIFSLEANTLTTIFLSKGLETFSNPRLFVYQYLWEFTNNMVIRFEPFLIGFYLFIRFRK